MKCILFGATGQVGGAVARALIASDVCSGLTLLGRRVATDFEGEAKVEQVVVDTGAPDFEDVVREKARGHDVAISCIGVGAGTARMSEEAMTAIEVEMVGRYARGCKAAGIEVFELLTAVGVTEESAKARSKYFRVLGKKHVAVQEAGFEKLAVFKPGTIVGNANTPRWITGLTGLIPDAWGYGNIHQDEIGRAFVAHLEEKVAAQSEPVVAYGNKEMKELIRG